MEENPILRAVKIQARIVIPIVKALERELGKERAHKIVGDAIASDYAQFQASKTPDRDTHPGATESSGPGFPITRDVVENTDDTYGFNVTSCEFADYFNSIGEPEIGGLMTCGVDFATEELVRPSWQFRRTQTRMQGAPHCDFRWRKTQGPES